MTSDRDAIFGDSSTRRVLLVLVVAALVALAGCGGPGDNSTNGTDDSEVTTVDSTVTTDGTGTDDGTATASPGDNGTDNGTDNGSNASGDTSLRVAHLSPDAPNVDVLVDGEPFAENVSFGTVTNYTEVAPGEYNVSVTVANNSSAEVFNDTVTLEAGAYTAAALGEVSENATESFEVRVLEDRSNQSNETAAARLVHASPGAGPVDVTLNTSGTDNDTNDTNGTNASDGPTVVFDDVAFGDVTEYVEVPGGSYSLDIRPATPDNDGDVLTTVDVTVENRTAYTAFAAGYVLPDQAPANTPFEVVVAVDGPTGEMEMPGNGTDGNGTDGNATDGNTSDTASVAVAPLA